MRWALLILLPALAWAEEPCRPEADTVICTRPGFDTLVSKVLEARQAAERCRLEREGDAADRKVLDARLALVTSERELALARVRELEARPFPRGRMFAAVGLGLVGGLAGVVAVQVQSQAAGMGLGGLSLVSLATAAVLVALE